MPTTSRPQPTPDRARTRPSRFVAARRTSSRISTSRRSYAGSADADRDDAGQGAFEPQRAEVARLRSALERVVERIATAAERAGRHANDVHLVAASKSVAADRLRAAVDAGITTFGENRVQEAEAKVAVVQGAQWHMIGRLQANKVNRAAQLFDVVESVDSLALAEKLSAAARETRQGSLLPTYLQVNVDRDPGKQGFDPDALADDLPTLARLPSLELLGLMTVGRMVDRPEDARTTFRRLRELSKRLRAGETRLGAGLSMGMSDDFDVAVEEGATVVRVGRAIFGERPRP